MTILSELNGHISSNKLKLILLATPIVVGSGAYLYYYYRKSGETQTSGNKTKKTITPLDKSLELKNKGNECFRLSKYEDALKLYTEAIQICPVDRNKELSTFYQNRAACYENLKQHEKVVEDCSNAIKNDKLYVKAYLRRGKANEILNRYEDAAFDYYVASCSSAFQNSDHMKLLFEVLEKFAYGKAREVMAKRTVNTFQIYLFRHIINKFSRDPLKFKSKISNNYNEVVTNLLKDDSNDDSLDLDLKLLKGTIEMLIGKNESGEERLRKIVDTCEENDYKINSEKIDSTNPDVYYIRSQMHLISKSFENAINDLNKSIEFDPNFACAIGQKLYIEYQQSMMLNNFIKKNSIIEEFEKAVNKFPKSNELLLLYFQILLSNNETKKAESFINKALENDDTDPTLYVYRALVYVEEGDLEKTREYLDKALKIDSKCSFAYEIYADLCSKLENMKDASSYLESAINCSTTFEDVKNLILKHKSLELQNKAPSFS
ncbi:hypothetical protein RDWZM_008102 [Blomia tropicalis]|uniref:Mitochondrial import receptor subunit TOM70 n=1 Tax=Blomia tropicalis TaxID=40697 RepID=A0A9Q0M0C5_BLOTA|nr:hypothetical protein RDWZM_008102 [Blomia tropicalis]